MRGCVDAWVGGWKGAREEGSGTDRIPQPPMLMQISYPPIHNRAHGPGCLGAVTHQPAIDGVDDVWRAGYEDYGAGRDAIDLLSPPKNTKRIVSHVIRHIYIWGKEEGVGKGT
jgi:hypothetical protein